MAESNSHITILTLNSNELNAPIKRHRLANWIKSYIMVKGSMQQEELMILNIYARNTGAPRYIEQVLNDLQRQLDSHILIVGDFNNPLSVSDRSTRQKID